MFEPFVIDGKLSRKDLFYASILYFLHTKIGECSLLFGVSISMFWALTFFEYKLIFGPALLLTLSPWLRRFLYLGINLYGHPRISCDKIEFNSDGIRISSVDKDFNFIWEFPRDSIMTVNYFGNYIFILNKKRNCVIINRRILSDEIESKIANYISTSPPPPPPPPCKHPMP